MYGCWLILCICEQVDRYKSNKLFHLGNENQLDALFILGLFHPQPLHVSGIPVTRHQEVFYIYTYNNWCVLCFLVDFLLAGLGQICLKHVEVDWRNKLRINSISSWFSLHGCIEMHGQKNIKFTSKHFTKLMICFPSSDMPPSLCADLRYYSLGNAIHVSWTSPLRTAYTPAT